MRQRGAGCRKPLAPLKCAHARPHPPARTGSRCAAMRSMVRLMPTLNTHARFAVAFISLPRVDALLDDPRRYMLEENLPRRERTDLRRIRQGKASSAAMAGKNKTLSMINKTSS